MLASLSSPGRLPSTGVRTASVLLAMLGHLPVGHVRVVSDALAGGEQHLKLCIFRPIEQVPAGQGVPATLLSRFDIAAEKSASQLSEAFL